MKIFKKQTTAKKTLKIHQPQLNLGNAQRMESQIAKIEYVGYVTESYNENPIPSKN